MRKVSSQRSSPSGLSSPCSRAPDPAFDGVQPRRDGLPDRRIGAFEGVVRQHHAAEAVHGPAVPQQHVADPFQHRSIAGEPADGVEARGEARHTGQRDAAMGRAQAEHPAIARRHPHRAAAIGADGEIHQPAGNRHRRARRRAAGQAVRRARIGRRAVMRVLAGERIAELVANGASDEVGAGVEQSRRRGRGLARRLVRSEPGRMAEAGAAAGDIEHVLGREAQPVERALRGTPPRDVVVRAEGTERIGKCRDE